MLKLDNTLSGKKEEFKPINKGRVGMYSCGPTVYDYVHIGNLRAFLTSDLVRRSLEYLDYEVKQVMNVTDVGIGGDNDEGEDKIIKGLRREGKPITLKAMKELTEFYTAAFLEDIAKLNIKSPHVLPKASEHIDEDIELVKKLEKKGFVYKASDGIYFDTSQDPLYGRLGGLSNTDHSRINIKSEKKNPRDFALWKFNTNLGYESPWGQGFPGWHLECSAMSEKYLGEHFDIHTGGIDLAPIHHNNEIAQSTNACDCKFVNYWIHNAFVNLGEGKMAKSEGNTITLRTLEDKGINPLAYRYWLLQARYSSPVTFSDESISAASIAFEKLALQYKELDDNGTEDESIMARFKEMVEDDINTPEIVALVWTILKDGNISGSTKKATIKRIDNVLGLNLDTVTIKNSNLALTDLPDNIRKMVEEREEARKDKDFKKSDDLRNELKSLGYKIEDKPEGPQISK